LKLWQIPLTVGTGWNNEQGFEAASSSLDSKLQNIIIGKLSIFGEMSGKFFLDKKLVDTLVIRFN
jgi:hypothetical protein